MRRNSARQVGHQVAKKYMNTGLPVLTRFWDVCMLLSARRIVNSGILSPILVPMLTFAEPESAVEASGDWALGEVPNKRMPPTTSTVTRRPPATASRARVRLSRRAPPYRYSRLSLARCLRLAFLSAMTSPEALSAHRVSYSECCISSSYRRSAGPQIEDATSGYLTVGCSFLCLDTFCLWPSDSPIASNEMSYRRRVWRQRGCRR